MGAAGEASPESTAHAFRRLAPFFAAIYFVQGIAEPGAGILRLPIFFLLKDRLGLSPGDIATFMAVVAVAWTVKPLYGLTSDFFPLFGYRRKSYLLLTTALAGGILAFLGLQPNHPYGTTLSLLVLCGFGLAFSDVLCDAVMVETGKPLGMTGRFQSVQWGAINTACLLAGVGGGWLAQHMITQHTFLLVSAFPAISFLTALVTLREPRSRFDRQALATAARAIRSAVGARDLWLTAGFIFFWRFSPSFGVPLQVYMVDELRFSKMDLGVLDSLSCGAAVAGALLFGRYFRGLPVRRLLNFSIGIGVVSTLAYWGLVGWWSALGLTIGTGVITMVAHLAMLDLAARSCPEKAEGTFFAALMSVFNLGTSASTYVGGKLFEVVGLAWLIFISGAATALCWLVVPLIRVPERGAAEGEVEASPAPAQASQ